jgi:hypothetical protein
LTCRDKLREPPKRFSPTVGPAPEEIDVRSLTVFEVRRPTVMRAHGEQKGLERIARPGLKLLQVQQLPQFLSKGPAEQRLERR